MTRKNIAVVGAGGFIGGHLVRRLLDEGHRVVAVDIKPWTEWHQCYGDAESMSSLDASDPLQVRRFMYSMDEVYNLAADMGGMGFIETHKAECMLSVLTSTNVLRGALASQVSRIFYSSSACVYPGYLQGHADAVALREDHAYPADPEDGYGWEKLFSERMHRHFMEDYGIEARVARYHNVYGPHGTWNGGREKAPAAICRKVAQAALTKQYEIGIWGDGEQTRSFMYIDDCIEGTRRLMDSEVREPLNIGSAELVSINELVSIVEDIAGVPELKRTYDLNAPKGVRGRNSDNTLIRERLGWEPSITLREGLERTYAWVYDQVRKELV